MLFFKANLFATALAVLMAVLVVTINVSAQHNFGHDPDKPGPAPSQVVGKCCDDSRCELACKSIEGRPTSGTKHDLGPRESMAAWR